MMSYAQALRDAILQAAMQGKLTEQLSSDTSAENMFRLIEAEKANGIKSKKIKRDNSCSIKKYNPLEDGIFEIPSSWRWVKLGELCQKIGAGSTPSGGSKVYVSEGVKFLREQNVHNDGISYEGIVFIPEEIHSSMGGSKVIAKDILLNITGASIGRNSLVPDDFDTANVNQHVLVIRFVDERLRLYVHLCLQAPFVYNQMMAEQKGDKPGLSATRVSNFLVPLPPIEEQQRIVVRVNELLAKVDEFEKIENRLTAVKEKFPSDLRAAILQAAMQGKLTEHYSTDGDVDDLISSIKSDKIQLLSKKQARADKDYAPIDTDEMLFDIPTYWKWMRLGEIGVYKKGPFGSSLTKSMFVPKSNTAVKVYEQKNAIQKDSHIGTYYITKEYYNKAMKGFTVEPGDIIVSCAGTIGETFVLPPDSEIGTINQALMRMNISEHINTDYFLIYFDHVLKLNAQRSSQGTAIKNIPAFDVLKKMLIPIPPIEEQQRIVERLDALLPLCDELTEE